MHRVHAKRLAHLWAILAIASPLVASAQTIADYGRSQRLLLEVTMAQNAARAAALVPPGASAPAPGAVAAPPGSPPSLPGPAALPRTPPRPPEPEVRVSGVFVSPSRCLAEVLVDGAPFVLATGQGVPGTSWRVASIVSDRVVLDRPGRREPGRGAPEQRAFPLVSSR